MDPIHSGSTTQLENQRCVFPVSQWKSDENQSYGDVKVFGKDDLLHGQERSAIELNERLQAAWAVVLRFYVVNDIVSFAIISDSQDYLCNVEPPRPRIHHERTTKIVSYDIPNHAQLRDVHVASSKIWEQRDWAHGQVNTAIHFFERHYPQNAGAKQPEAPYEEALKGGHMSRDDFLAVHCDLTLRVVDRLSDTSLAYLKPRVPDYYALSIARMFKRILQLFIDHEGLLAGEIDALDKTEKNMMRSWNPADPFAAEQRFCMHHLVEAKARENPNAEAVCAWDGTLTYAELDVLSDMAACYLRNVGVRVGVNVPFGIEKSMWAVVAMLAILKSGGAFVPLNPQDPPTRLAEIIKSVKADVVATSNTFLPVFVGLVDHVVVISAESIHANSASDLSINSHGIKEKTGAFEAPVTPDDRILVLFTSGSTGKPKGMVHTHASICTHALTHGEAMCYYRARVVQFAAHTFDVAIMDIFTTLLFGGCICIPSEEDRRSNIVEVINAMKADYAILTPSFAGLIDPSEVPTLKTLAVGGEALPQDRTERWADRVRLIQIYGPAEVGICLLKYMERSTRPENVGYPLLNSSCWLVDPDNSDCLVPIGAVGELLVAGPSVAQGYVGHELKTQAAFIDAPIWAKTLGLPYRCFYKTGDLLKYNIEGFDGSYVFISRKDAQLKLRGQRLEPGEVEYHIGRLPGVVNSLVTQPGEGAFKGELVAVVQLQNLNGKRTHFRNEPIRLTATQALTVQSVRENLAKILPKYMIPTVCLTVDNMPFVPSLKIDRRVVNTWLARMKSRPRDTSWKTPVSLRAQEATATSLSIQVAEILENRRNGDVSMFEFNDFVLQETGINSIQIMSFSMYLQKHYKKIPMNILLNPGTTIRQLADIIDNNHIIAIDGHVSVPETSQFPVSHDCFEDARSLTSSLLSSIPLSKPIPTPCIKPPSTHNILLTGATGYLGLAILHHLLLANPSAHIYALIRCTSPSSGLSKLISAAQISGWCLDEYTSRIHVWPGDLEAPSLGLGDTEKDLMEGLNTNAENIHVIIHNGARVHYSTSYSALQGVNVLSTLELLKFAAKSRTISRFVFVSGGEKPSIDASSPIASDMSHSSSASGYMLSKYVCEEAIRSCAPHPLFLGKALSIVKPGYIIGPLTTGIANQNDFIWRLIATCVETGFYNKDELRHWLYISSIDCVAAHVIHCVYPPGTRKIEEGRETIERVLSGFYFKDLWLLVESVLGRRLEPLDGGVWTKRLKRRVLEVGEKHLLFPLLDVLERDGRCIGDIDVRYARRMKEKDGEIESEDTWAVVRRNLEYLISVGFFPSPEKPA